MSEKFTISYKSIFDTPANTYVNTINCVGAMALVLLWNLKRDIQRCLTIINQNV